MKIFYNKNLLEYARRLRREQTYAEKIFWNMVKGRKLGYDFHRQKPIGNFIYDFFCFELKLVVEIDGITHLDRLVQIKDEVKADYLAELDIKLLRFTDDDIIGNSNQVYEKLKNFISEFESAKVR